MARQRWENRHPEYGRSVVRRPDRVVLSSCTGTGRPRLKVRYHRSNRMRSLPGDHAQTPTCQTPARRDESWPLAASTSAGVVDAACSGDPRASRSVCGLRERRMLTRAYDLWFPQWSPDVADSPRGSPLQAHLLTPGARRRRQWPRLVASGPESGTVGVWAWSPGSDASCSTVIPNLQPRFDLFLYSLKDDRDPASDNRSAVYSGCRFSQPLSRHRSRSAGRLGGGLSPDPRR